MVKRAFSLGIVSDTGEIKSSNQDHLLAKVGEDDSGEFGLFAVADGVGGMDAGYRASALAIDILDAWWDDSLLKLICDIPINGMGKLKKELDIVMKEINMKIFDLGLSSKLKMGTTLTVLFIYQSFFIIRHVGDTRAYLLDTRLRQLTEDHTVKHQAYKNILTRCMGVSESVEIYKGEGILLPDDRILLCSDGFYTQLQNYELYNSLRKSSYSESNLQDNVEDLAMIIRGRKSPDNFSAIVIGQNWHKSKKHKTLQKLRALIGI